MKLSKQAYTAEFKELAVKRVKSGQSVSTVVRDLGLGDQTLRNWVAMRAAAGQRVGFKYANSLKDRIVRCHCRTTGSSAPGP